MMSQLLTDAPDARATRPSSAGSYVERAPAAFPVRWATVGSFLAADVAAIVLVGLIALGVLALAPESYSGLVLQVTGPVALLLMSAFALSGLYQVNSVHPALEMKRAAVLTGIVSATFGLGLYVFAPSIPGLILVMATVGMLAVLIIPLVRGLFRVCCARFSWWGVPTVVISSAGAADEVMEILQRWPELGLKPVGVVQPSPREEVRGVPVIGRELLALPEVRRRGITHAVIASPDMTHRELSQRVQRFRRFFTQVSVIPAGPDIPAIWTSSNTWDGLTGFDRSERSLQFAAAGKRVLDLLITSVALLLLAPLWITIAVLLKRESDGPILFRQERMGQHGRLFTLYKFRTMHADAEDRLAEMLERDPGLKEEYETYHKLKDDPRVTRVGEILRSTSLDELPQLLNVLKGDMSLVGPRAYVPGERDEMNGHAATILQSQPGVTGLWQVAGRNELTFDERVRTDVHYTQNWSFWMDLYILVRTVPVVVTREGAC